MDVTTQITGADVASTSSNKATATEQSINSQTPASHELQAVPVDVLLNDSNKVEELQQIFESAEPADVNALAKVASELTEMMSVSHKSIQFQVHEESGKTVVSVMDTESGEIIRQIPSEEAIELAEKFAEVSGLLLKTEV